MVLKEVCPRSAIVFVVQVITVLVVVVMSAIKLSMDHENNPVWLVLVSSALGFILPAPALKKKKCDG